MLLIADIPHQGPLLGQRCWVYALVDPRTNEVRYIGCSRNIAVRSRYHCSSNGGDSTAAFKEWKGKLRVAGLKPQVFLLEAVEESARRQSEFRWIQLCLSQGANLLNKHVNLRKSK